MPPPSDFEERLQNVKKSFSKFRSPKPEKVVTIKQGNVELHLTQSQFTDLQEKAKRENPTTKLAECKVCGTALNRRNRCSVRDENNKLRYPSICKFDAKHLTDRDLLLIARGVHGVPRSLLTTGPQGSPSGRSEVEIGKEITQVQPTQETIEVPEDKADLVAKYLNSLHRNIKSSFGRFGQHTPGSPEVCMACRRARVAGVSQVKFRAEHDTEINRALRGGT